MDRKRKHKPKDGSIGVKVEYTDEQLKARQKALNQSPDVNIDRCPITHQLEYSIYSCKVSWCPICNEHFFNDRNAIHTTIATVEHFHVYLGS